jgi:hypothetical protein
MIICALRHMNNTQMGKKWRCRCTNKIIDYEVFPSSAIFDSRKRGCMGKTPFYLKLNKKIKMFALCMHFIFSALPLNLVRAIMGIFC